MGNLTITRPNNLEQLQSSHKKMANLIAAVRKYLPPAEVDIRHHFIPGGYVREMIIPQGILVVGRIIYKDTISAISQGKLLVYLGPNDTEILDGPKTFVATPGAQRAALALTEVRWVTFMVTDEKDPDVIFDTMTSEDPQQFYNLLGERQ